jgi:diguanylate cyclase (GGDEF)-like protein
LIGKRLSGHAQSGRGAPRWRSLLAIVLFWALLVTLTLALQVLEPWFKDLGLLKDGFALPDAWFTDWPVWLAALLLSFLYLRSHWKNQDAQEERIRISRTDALTMVATRLFFEEMAYREMRRAEREGHEVSLLLIAVDRMRTFNERRGRRMGDLALRAIAETIRDGLRDLDWIGRLDSDQFLVLAKGGPEVAQMLGERLRQAISGLALPGIPAGEGALTASIGHSSSGIGSMRRKTLAPLLADAEIACYAAKDGGRNQVVGFSTGG